MSLPGQRREVGQTEIMESNKDIVSADVLAKIWILEYCCQKICTLFVHFTSDTKEASEMNLFYTIMSDILTGLPSFEVLDSFHRAQILMSELCLRLLRKELEFEADDEFHSLNDSITYLCHQFNIDEKRTRDLQKSFNSQKVLIFHRAGLSEKAQEAFAKSVKEGMHFKKEIKEILENPNAAETANHLSFTSYIRGMQTFVKSLLKKLGRSMLEQMASAFQNMDHKPRLDSSELLSLFRLHIGQMKQDTELSKTQTSNGNINGSSSNDDGKEDPVPEKTLTPQKERLKRPKLYRKLYNHKKTHVDLSDVSMIGPEGNTRSNQQKPGKSSHANKLLSSRKRNHSECTATRPENEGSEEHVAKPLKKVKHLQNRDSLVVLSRDVDAAADIIAAAKAAADLNTSANVNTKELDNAGKDAKKPTMPADDNGTDAAVDGFDAPDNDADANDQDDDNIEGNDPGDDDADADDDGADVNYDADDDVADDDDDNGDVDYHHDGNGRDNDGKYVSDDNAGHDEDPDEGDPSDNDAEANYDIGDYEGQPQESQPPQPLSTNRTISVNPRVRRTLNLVRSRAESTPTTMAASNSNRTRSRPDNEAHTSGRTRSRARIRHQDDDEVAVNDVSGSKLNENSRRSVRSNARNQAERAAPSRHSRHNVEDAEISSTVEPDNRHRSGATNSSPSPGGESGPSRKRTPFTEQEEAWLRRGVRRYGVGHWAQILERYPFQGRTSVNLKDKWRNIMKKENSNSTP